MKLTGLIERLDYTVLQGDININVKDIQHHSDRVTEGSLFVCLEGFRHDGHSYIGEALENGAAAVIATKYVQVNVADIPVIQVDDTREALAYVASKYFNYPTNQFNLVGITGSSRKTLTSILIDRLLQFNDKKTGIINGYGTKIVNEKIATRKVVPDPLKLHELFYSMKEANVNDVVMEVQASDLDMKRMAGADFDVAVFTILTEDAIDALTTREAHREAKLKLFEMARNAVINMDSEDGTYLIENSSQERLLTYSCIDEKADLCALNVNDTNGETAFELVSGDVTYQVSLPVVAGDLLYGVLAAVGAVTLLGVSIENAVAALGDHKFFDDDELKTLLGDA